MCCNQSSKLSFNERVQFYISKKEEIETEYKSRMKALKEEASADILANCPIKVGDVYVTEDNNAWGVKLQYYKVAKVDADIDGTVTVYGYKRKLDKTWGKRDNIYMFSASIYNSYNVNHYDKVEDYVEPTKD
jgi:hypothetical protein